MQLILRLAALAAAFAPSPIYAVLLGVPNEAIESTNRKYVLVLLVPESYYREAGYELRDYDPQLDGTQSWSSDDIRRAHQAYLREVALRAKYPASGLYQTDDPSTPLWTTAWSSRVKDVFVSNDGVHHVFAFQEWDSTISNRGNAVEFYANGNLLASYSEFELLPSWRLRFLAARYLNTDRPTCTAARLNDSTGRFTIHTNHGDLFEFDIATGQLVRSTSPWSGSSSADHAWPRMRRRNTVHRPPLDASPESHPCQRAGNASTLERQHHRGVRQHVSSSR